MISIVMPVLNREETITKAVLAALSSPHVCEVLIADGGSSDGTLDCIHAINDDRLRVVSRADRGIFNGANIALGACSGAFIMFMNSDDFLEPDFLEKVIAADAVENADFYFGATTSEGRVVQPRLRASAKPYKVWQVMPFPHVSLVLRQSVHKAIGLYDESFKVAADLDFSNRLILSGARGVYINASAAECSPGGISSGFRHISEARRAAIKNGKSSISATIFAVAVALYRIGRR